MNESHSSRTDVPYDPTAEYHSCCHPQHMPVGTVARDTYDAAMVTASAVAAEADAERRALVDLENAQQEARAAAAAVAPEVIDAK